MFSMKKFIVLAMTLFVLLFFTACRDSQPELSEVSETSEALEVPDNTIGQAPLNTAEPEENTEFSMQITIINTYYDTFTDLICLHFPA
jgi:ABC-type oligopeptide transport system substrate-binding subunit